MPRISISGIFEDIPLSVTAVSLKIGVPASTLRTWERRYGLGPSARTMGSHRRYTATDIARLHLMCKLIQDGHSACDAAFRVRAASLEELGICGHIKPSDARLFEASMNNDSALTQAIIRESVSELGLLKSWEKLIKPALEQLGGECNPTPVGVAPYQFLRYELLKFLNKVEMRTHLEAEETPSVLLVTPLGQECESTVLGVALQWENIRVQQVNLRAELIPPALSKILAAQHYSVIVLINLPEGEREDALQIAKPEHVPMVIIDKKREPVFAANATVLHSLSAALAEIVAIVE